MLHAIQPCATPHKSNFPFSIKKMLYHILVVYIESIFYFALLLFIFRTLKFFTRVNNNIIPLLFFPMCFYSHSSVIFERVTQLSFISAFKSLLPMDIWNCLTFAPPSPLLPFSLRSTLPHCLHPYEIIFSKKKQPIKE